MVSAGANKNKKWPGYTLYVVLVTGILLYYLFPAQPVEEFLNNGVKRINQGLVFKAEKIRPWLPSGLRISDGNVFWGGVKAPLFKTDTFYAGLQMLKFLKGEYSFDLSGKAYGGDMKGTLQLAGKSADSMSGNLVFNDFLVQNYAFLTEMYEHRLTGRLSGDITYAGETSGKQGGEGRLDLKLSDGQIQFKKPLFNIGSVALQNIRLEAQIRRRELTITKAELTGPEVNGTMTGTILLHGDINHSEINLKGTLEPQAAFYQHYPDISDLLKSLKKRVKRGQYFFAVTGTLGEPKFRLL